MMQPIRASFVAFVLGVSGALGAIASAQHVMLTVDGVAAGEVLGRAVDPIGDLTGDGVPEILAGAPSATGVAPSSGYMVVLDGAAGTAFLTFAGAQNGSVLGTSVAAAGDIDLDGVPDMIAGSPLVLPPLPFGPPNPPGKAFVYSGATGLTLFTFASANLADGFGRAVDGGADVNNDGRPDVVVGADFGNFAQAFSGANGAVLHTWNGDAVGDFFGFSVAMVGDANGDGFAEVAVGARLDDDNGTDSGRVKVFSGASGLPMHVFDGDSAGDNLGYSVAGAGDVDGDGDADVIAGARNDDDGGVDAGSARVWSGATGAILHTLHGEAAGDGAGNTNGVDGAGDANGDGVPDLLVASALNDAHGTSSGRVRILSGVNGSLLENHDGPMADYILGVAARGGVDFNGDGLADAVLGAFGDDAIAGANAGHVRVVTTVPTASWAGYGAGWPGTLGVPSIAALSNPIIGGSFVLQVGNSLGASTSGLLLAGFASASIPTNLGGTLLLAPNPNLAFAIPISTPSLLLPATLPNLGTLGGVSVFVQVLEIDAGASKGVSFTPGIELKLGL